MSSSIGDIECPKCGGRARVEQDTHTGERHAWCNSCGWNSDDEDD